MNDNDERTAEPKNHRKPKASRKPNPPIAIGTSLQNDMNVSERDSYLTFQSGIWPNRGML